jgi:hypothetical protein
MKASLVSIGFIVLSVSLSAMLVSVDPDGFASGTDISTAFPNVTLSSGGGAAGLNGKVYAAASSSTSTGGMVFGNSRTSSKLWLNSNTNGYYLRADFTIPTRYVSIDFIDSGSDYFSVWFYTTAGDLIKQNYLTSLTTGTVYPVVIERDTADIVYIRAGGWDRASSTVLLDNLKFEVPEPATCLILLSGWLLLKKRKK